MSEIADIQPSGFVTLDVCIRNALMDIGESLSRYEQFKKWAIDCLRDLNFDLISEVKTVKLPLTAWKSVEWPVDYVDWVILGVVIDNKINVFTHDDRIPLPADDEYDDGEPPALVASVEHPVDQIAPPGRLWFWNFNHYGEDVGKLFGLTTKDSGVGYFKINRKHREFQFSPSIDGNTTVYLEYISDGFDPSERSVVNAYAGKLVELYIHWQRTDFSKANQAEKARAKDRHDKYYIKVQNRIQKITVEDVLECARDGYRLVSSF